LVPAKSLDPFTGLKVEYGKWRRSAIRRTAAVRTLSSGGTAVEHRCSLIVRSYECDGYGHVNNANYLHYLEFARHVYLSDNGISLPELRESGCSLLVARIAIDFRRPTATDDQLIILTRALRKTRIGGVLAQRILRDAETVAEAEVTWVCVDARGRLARLPAAFDREGLSP
jgi:YbgC/YbaW family acyl-CoA thioester hydrolase